jgi:hypothetical protein
MKVAADVHAANEARAEARALDDSATPRNLRAILPAAVESPFVYVDNATPCARIDAVSRKLELAARRWP